MILGGSFGVTIALILDELFFQKIPQNPPNLILIFVSVILGTLFKIKSNYIWSYIIYSLEKNGNYCYKFIRIILNSVIINK